MKRRSFQVALAGISAGMTLLFVWLANYVSILTFTFYALAACALMLPLCKKYYWSAGFAYIASSLLSFLVVGNIFKVLPFIMLIGPYTIFTCVCILKNVKVFISLPIKIVFINAVLAVFYFAFTGLVLDFSSISFLDGVHYAWIAVLATLVLLVADIIFSSVFKQVKRLLDRAIRD